MEKSKIDFSIGKEPEWFGTIDPKLQEIIIKAQKYYEIHFSDHEKDYPNGTVTIMDEISGEIFDAKSGRVIGGIRREPCLKERLRNNN
ncbi:MAG: hypothetical protein FWD40_10725 [Treponema sp.]|nr:hypothetical protein [Treponema sp.]